MDRRGHGIDETRIPRVVDDCQDAFRGRPMRDFVPIPRRTSGSSRTRQDVGRVTPFEGMVRRVPTGAGRPHGHGRDSVRDFSSDAGVVVVGDGRCECGSQPTAGGECADRGGIDRCAGRDRPRRPAECIRSWSGPVDLAGGLALGRGLRGGGRGRLRRRAVDPRGPRHAVAGTAPGPGRSTLLAAFVVIPLGTVIPEEFAFRGVLWGLLRRRSGRWVATVVSSATVRCVACAPALAGGSTNEAVDAVVGGGAVGGGAAGGRHGAVHRRRRGAVLRVAGAQRQPARSDAGALGGQRARARSSSRLA